MGEIRSFSGGKKADKDEVKCVYCNMVPVSKHPGLTCPRISGVTLADDWEIAQILFMDPRDWAVFVKECGEEE